MSGGGSPLIERDAELGELTSAIERARAGRGSVVSIRGPAGIGKTSLLRSAVDIARERGLTVLAARGGELEREFPFGVVRQLLESRVVAAEGAERNRLMAGAARLGAPALGIQEAGQTQIEPSFGLLHGLYWLVANLCLDNPLLLVIDDAHLADFGSLRFLLYLARRQEDLPVLTLIGRRSGDPATDEHLVALLADAPEMVIVPRALTKEGAGKLLESQLGERPLPSLVARCWADTGGNPFLLRQLALQVRAEGGGLIGSGAAQEAVSRAILLRLGGLGTNVLALARAVVIFGDGCSLAEAAALAGLELRPASDAAAALIRAEIFASDKALRFVHPLVRTAVDAELTPAEQGEMHRRAARLLIDRNASEDRITAQLLISEPGAEPYVAERLHAAGTDALTKGTAAAAVTFLRRSLAEPPSEDRLPVVLLDLGTAELTVGELDSACEHLRAALERVSTAEARVAAGLALAQALALSEGPASAIATLDELAAGIDGDAWLRIDVERLTIGMTAPELAPESIARIEHSYAGLSGETAAERLALAASGFRHAMDPAMSAAVTRPIVLRGLRSGKLLDEQTGDSIVWGAAAYALILCEDFDAAQREIDAVFDDARERGSLLAFLQASLGSCEVELSRGDLIAAITHGEAGVGTWPDLSKTATVKRWAAACMRFFTLALLDRGEIDRARTLVGEWEQYGDPLSQEFAPVLAVRGMVALADREPRVALADLLTFGDLGAQTRIEDRVSPWRLAAAQAAAQLDQRKQAVALADEALEMARTWGTPGGLGAALRIMALVAERTRARSLMEEAVAVLGESERRLELAKARADLGSLLLRAGKKSAGIELLKVALEGATRCGAAPLIERAHTELRIAGARPRKLMFSGIEGLTASERRVAAMAAEGMSNRQIAETLFVTTKTVETHVSSALRKLSITSRRELPASLRESEPAITLPG